jgi:hypothetical protein
MTKGLYERQRLYNTLGLPRYVIKIIPSICNAHLSEDLLIGAMRPLRNSEPLGKFNNLLSSIYVLIYSRVDERSKAYLVCFPP